MNAWDNLSLTEKSEMIRVAVENGITTLPEIRKAYNEFAEGGSVDNINTYETGGYKPSENIKSRITQYEGKSMTGARDPISGKWGKNSSFEAEARGFYKALPVSIREQVLSNPELADSLYSYSYNVGAGNFKKRVVPALERYYAGVGSVKDIEDSMWATHDNKLRGLQRRRAEEKAGVRNALMGEAMPLLYTEQVVPEFTPFNPQAFSTFMGVDGSNGNYTAPQVVDVEEPLVQAAMESAYSPEQIEREERAQGLRNLGLAMSIMRGNENHGNSSLWDTVGLLTGSQYKHGGKIHIKPENRGKFTALKKRTGHSATWFKQHGTPAQKKMATFALNARKWKHGLGGNLFSGEDEPTQQMKKPVTTGGAGYVPPTPEHSNELLKDIAYRVMSQDSYQSRYVSDIIKATLEAMSGQPYKPNYTGSFAWNPATKEEAQKDELNRDLNHLVIFGNTKKQFEPTKISGFDYSDFLRKNYGVTTLPTYKGHIENTSKVSIPTEYRPLVEYLADRPNMGYYSSGTEDDINDYNQIIEDGTEPFKAIDDTASYRKSFRRDKNGNPELAVQDLIDYKGNYGGKYGLIAGLQGDLLTKVINSPVLLDQGIPVNYSDNPEDYQWGPGWYYTLQNLVDNNKILESTTDGYEYPLVLPNIDVKGSRKKAYGGNLFDGTTQPTQQMNSGLNLYRRTNNLGETEYIYQETPDSEEILLTPTNKRFSDDPTNWDYKDASGREYSPRMTTTYNPGEIREDTRGPLERMVDDYFGELKYQINNNVPISGKYTMPAIAAAPFLAWAGEAAYPYVSTVLANPYVDAGIKSAFAGHGLNHTINESIDGWGDAAITAMELAPLGRLARPMYNAGIDAAASGRRFILDVGDRYQGMKDAAAYRDANGIKDARAIANTKWLESYEKPAGINRMGVNNDGSFGIYYPDNSEAGHWYSPVIEKGGKMTLTTHLGGDIPGEYSKDLLPMSKSEIAATIKYLRGVPEHTYFGEVGKTKNYAEQYFNENPSRIRAFRDAIHGKKEINEPYWNEEEHITDFMNETDPIEQAYYRHLYEANEPLSIDSYKLILQEAAKNNGKFALRYDSSPMGMFNPQGFYEEEFYNSLQSLTPKEQVKAINDWMRSYYPKARPAYLKNGEVMIPRPLLMLRSSK